MLNAEALSEHGNLQSAVQDQHPTVPDRAMLHQILPQLLGRNSPLPVIDSGGSYLGVITAASVLRKISQGANHV
jgi:hypothetical protein